MDLRCTIESTESVQQIRGIDLEPVAALAGNGVAVATKPDVQDDQRKLSKRRAFPANGGILAFNRLIAGPQPKLVLKTALNKK